VGFSVVKFVTDERGRNMGENNASHPIIFSARLCGGRASRETRFCYAHEGDNERSLQIRTVVMGVLSSNVASFLDHRYTTIQKLNLSPSSGGRKGFV
jgi:hypothetical protein